MEVVVFDSLKWAKDPDIMKIIGKEILYYSNKITKINHYNIGQERFLVLTDESLYNFQKKKLKRKIEYNKIQGITYSKISPELFVVHGNEVEYDYYFQTHERNLLIKLISKFYEEQTGKPLKLCEVNEKTLKNYVTGKKDKKKDSTYTKMDLSRLIDLKKFLYENQFIEKKIRTMSCINFTEENKIDDEKPSIIKTSMIFCKEPKLEKSTLDNFKIMKIIGRGEYGKVFLVRNNLNNEYYAMKSIKKEILVDKNEIKEILVNKKIIQKLNYQFLIGCCACFQTEQRIYFIMDLIEGESFDNYLIKRTTIEETQIKFFIAIIGLTLEYFHKNGISYRNLRPNDILIQKDGYLKISDIKLSTLFNLKQNCLILKDSSEYIPPEEIRTKKGSKDGDWWIYGILLYELFFGIPPFFSEKEEKIKELIEKNQLRFPKESKVSKSAKDLITNLLNKDPQHRLGNIKDFDDIKNHEFFKGFNFEDIINKKMKSNYIPNIENVITYKEKKIEVSYEEFVNCKK